MAGVLRAPPACRRHKATLERKHHVPDIKHGTKTMPPK